MSRTTRIAIRRRQAIATLAIATMAPTAMLSPAMAQTAAQPAAPAGAWPNRAIKLIVPWSAGSGTDTTATGAPRRDGSTRVRHWSANCGTWRQAMRMSRSYRTGLMFSVTPDPRIARVSPQKLEK